MAADRAPWLELYSVLCPEKSMDISNIDIGSRIYPAIDAVLQRKAAIRALQQRCSTDAPPRQSGASSCNFQADFRPTAQIKDACETTQLAKGLAVPCEFNSSKPDCSSNTADITQPLPTAKQQLSSLIPADDHVRDTAGPYISGSIQIQQRMALPQSSSGRAASLPDAGQQISAQKDDVYAYAAEFARIRQLHQQRCTAAAVIQAAVRSWLARQHVKPQEQLVQQCEQQQLLLQQQCSTACVPLMASDLVSSAAQQHEAMESRAAATILYAASAETGTRLTFAVEVDPWHWRNIRRAVGLRCRQVLKQDGAYGMAAAYHRMRMEAAVLLGWRSVFRAANSS